MSESEEESKNSRKMAADIELYLDQPQLLCPVVENQTLDKSANKYDSSSAEKEANSD